MKRDELRLEIDENRLDDECIGQPRLYYEWASRLADAKRDLEEAKAEAEVVKAETAKAIRSDPSQFDLAKVTENSVEETVVVQDEYGDSLKAVRDARHKADVLQGAVVSLDQRKRMLEKLIELWMAGYFASPKVPGDMREQMDESSQRSTWGKGRRNKEERKGK